jgi:hypothetical protein
MTNLKLSKLIFAAASFLFSTSFALGANDKVKRPKIKWKEVEIVETEPKACEFIEKVDKDSNMFFTFSGKGFKAKALRGLKKKAGKLGGNTVLITDKMIIEDVLNYEAKVYFCTQEQRAALTKVTEEKE